MTEGFSFKVMEALSVEGRLFTKADILERFLAKLIDMLIVGALCAFPSAVGPVAGATYILISDGLKGGQSIGKRIIGLRVISVENPETPGDFKASILRNAVFGLLIGLWFAIGWIPYIGKAIVVVCWAAVVAVEMILIYTDDTGSRFGDRIAGSLVVSTKAADTVPAK